MKEKFPSSHEKPAKVEKAPSLRTIKTRLKKHKARIEELEEAKGNGTLASHYHHNKDYMSLANDEVVSLEEKIKELEAMQHGHADTVEKERIKDEIEKRKQRIRDLESAKGKGKLSPEYSHDAGYMNRANDEVVRLEAEIRALENEAKGIDVEEEEALDETLADVLRRVQAGVDERRAEREKEPPAPKQKRKLGVVETDLLEKRSREAAAESMTQNKEEYKGFKGWLKSKWDNTWKHNMMAEYYRAKEMAKVRKGLIEAGSVAGAEDVGGVEDKRIKDAILARFLENSPGLVHEAAGEWKDSESEVSPEKKAEAENAIREAIRQYVGNPDIGLAEGNLTEAINRAYCGIFANTNGKKGFEPLNIADNIKEYAREMRGYAIEHKIACAELDLDFELTFGKAVTGARTEEAYTWRDKMIEKMGKSPVGRFVNETTIAAAVCAAASVAQVTSRWSLRATIGWFGGGLVAGGALAAVRESQAVKRDRAEHARAMAAGRTFDEGHSPRRKEMHEATYNMMPVRQSIDNMRALSESGEGMTEEQVLELIGLVSAVDSRILASDRKKIDLLSYSNAKDFEVERTELDIERARAKAVAQKAYEKLGLDDKLGIFENYMGSQLNCQEAQIFYGEGGVGDKDKNFDALKKRRVRSAFGKGMLVAGVAGLVFHEVAVGARAGYEHLAGNHPDGATLQGYNSGAHNTAETAGKPHIPHHTKEWLDRHNAFHQADVDHAKVVVANTFHGDPHSPAETIAARGPEAMHTEVIGGATHEITETTAGVLKVPEGFHVIPGSNGHEYQIFQGGEYDAHGNLTGGKLVADHIEFDRSMPGHDGSYCLTQQSEEVLKKAGFNMGTISETTTSTEDFVTQKTVTLTPEQYAAAHPDQYHRIHRIGWGDNGTVKPDLNELRLNDPVIGHDGKIHISIRGMTHHGSTMGNKHLDVPELVKEGKMKLWISPTHDTQFTPVEVSFNAKGEAIFDTNGEAGKWFKFDSKGHLLSRPRFTEAAAIMGNRDGLPSAIICATDEELRAIGNVTAQVPVHGFKDLVSTKVTTDLSYVEPTPVVPLPPPIPVIPEIPKPIPDPIPVPHGLPVDKHDWPIPVPFYIPRSPLERLNPDKQRKVLNYYYGYGESHQMEEWAKDFSPRLRKNREAKLNPKEEISWYFQEQEKRHPGYIKNELGPLEKQNGQKMGEKVEGAICLAVAGHQEHKNIYRTLETYRVQQDKKGASVWKGKDSQFEIFIYVNWPSGTDPKLTIDEINRFKKEHPEVPVRVYNEEIKNKKVEVGWYKKKVFDLALREHSKRNTAGDIMLIANDADMTFTSPRYLSDVKETMNAPEAAEMDAMVGRFDLDPYVYEQNPTFHSAMRFWQFMESSMRVQLSQVGTQGRNTVMRGASYAAVGGNRTKDFWADVEFGQLFNAARGKNTVSYENKAWVMVDPRREIDKFKKGELIAHTWFDFNTRDVRGTKSAHDAPESIDVGQLATLGESSPEVTKFKDRLQDEIQEIMNVFGQATAYSPEDADGKKRPPFVDSVQKAAEYLGVKMELTSNPGDNKLKVRITETGKLRRALNTYKVENRKETKLNPKGRPNPLFTK